MNGYKVIAVIFTALVSVFFPDEFFENIRVESIQYFAIWNTVISVAGWGFFSTKFFQLIKNQGKISIFIAVQKKKIAVKKKKQNVLKHNKTVVKMQENLVAQNQRQKTNQ